MLQVNYGLDLSEFYETHSKSVNNLKKILVLNFVQIRYTGKKMRA
jgi:hypothetical protein